MPNAAWRLTWALGTLKDATGPQDLVCAQFGVPAVGMGVGNADSNNHAPNENILIDDYIEGIKHMAWVFHRFAKASG